MDTVNIKRNIRTAFKNKDNAKIKMLIGDDKEILNMVTAFGTWLHVAADFGNLEMVEYLLNLGLDINTEGGTFECGAIGYAASAGHIDIVKYLLDKGAIIDTSTAYRNPIFGAIYNGHKDVVELLVEVGTDISIRYTGENIKNMNAYEYARVFGQTEIAEYLRKITNEK
ncbi:Ankyrin repeat-containing protein [Clostridium cavendishii DSM 21758]|uniref:Ankyrin repeat-containing protein n=1 Tax=Clostridium cavendishii DSM 21758 TaxID=1121302 RepID=A0A1M6R0Y5_9CLOT|nr:ankyrin repeat domain-containing protein [Clostridium cavendishii]SHK26060.1 Ankyrin repeat-containing protein [Clostridium cavendishii DSM 21758]